MLVVGLQVVAIKSFQLGNALEDELQSVLKSLRKSGINIVAIHHHMTHESPRMLFLHYWGRGKAKDLAKAIKAAIDV